MPPRRRATAEQLALIDLPDSPALSPSSRAGRGSRRPGPLPDGDLAEFLTGLDAVAADLMGDIDPVMAELHGAAFGCIAAFGAGGDERIVPAILATLAEHPTPAALALVLAIQATAEGTTRQIAEEAAASLVAAGMPMPRWAGALQEPITAGDYWRMRSPDGEASVLLGSFHRAGATHVLVVTVDGATCGEASVIGVVAPEDLAELDGMLPGSVHEPIDPAAFRWEVESALRIRHEHDAEEGGPDPSAEETVEYAACAALLRTRLAVLPSLDRPLREHPEPSFDVPELIARTMVKPGGKARSAPKGKPTPKRSSAKGSRSSIYQVKVTLRGSKPPIWRRLEVPADVTLYRLHQVLQVAFEWDDTHLHQFVTPVGRFGRADPDLDLRADKRATLAEVAPDTKSRIVYEYDFGDSWEHEIVVEKILDRDPAVLYPRCTGGRRAAPPEDCGGVWGYADLLETLADPTHSEHEDLVEWLGLDSADEFDPEAFDPDDINRRLGALR